ncbi:gpW family head-tail joining protein [Janthinobacterium sp.]|uniref:gpW family head-tail joining protein n=1 Tax=Janthinobacterium sp. TaxID=1871054 RepID=UPI00293D9EBC|nr:gpW family head-tail joining protein [Janthinobacterium sp.]
MACYQPRVSLLAGRPTAMLQADLAAAQQAYLDISTGAKGESYSYTQGDGAKSVTYNRANIEVLTALIISLQVALGISGAGRRPIRFRM